MEHGKSIWAAFLQFFVIFETFVYSQSLNIQHVYGVNKDAVHDMSGEYPAVPNGANGRVVEVPGLSVIGDSDGNRRSRVFTVEYDLDELNKIV